MHFQPYEMRFPHTGSVCMTENPFPGGIVKISYARLDIISVQFNFTAVAYAKALKETQSQDIDTIFILGNPQGKKTQ